MATLRNACSRSAILVRKPCVGYRYVNSAGDFGGYDVIEVARFADDGEYIVVTKYRREDYEDFYEGDDDFALIDEF
jgi:hypothetical protein